jgi:hypothetical protein
VNCISGLKELKSDYKGAKDMLLALTPFIRNCVEDLNGAQLSVCLGSLKGMSSDDREVRTVLSAFIPKVRRMKHSLTAREVARILIGMQGILNLVFVTHIMFINPHLFWLGSNIYAYRQLSVTTIP